MRFAGNVIWFIFGGAVTALFWLLGAVVFALSIIGLPLTRSAIEMAKLSAWPFGREVVHVRELDGRELDFETATTGTIGFLFNILWAVTFGILVVPELRVAGHPVVLHFDWHPVRAAGLQACGYFIVADWKACGDGGIGAACA